MEVAKNDKGDVETDESLRPLREEYWERKELFDQAEALVDETKEEIRAALGTRTTVKVAGKAIYFKPQTTWRWDADSLSGALARSRTKVDYDGTVIPGDLVQIAKQFKSGSESRPLRIY